MKTNLDILMETIERANKENEEMKLVTSGSPSDESIIVIHGDKGYIVFIRDKEVLNCNCPDSVYRKKVCKHEIVVSKQLGLNLNILVK